MNTDHPADIAPLSFGPGLALGLLLILGLPSEPTRGRTVTSGRTAPDNSAAAPQPAMLPIPHVACN